MSGPERRAVLGLQYIVNVEPGTRSSITPIPQIRRSCRAHSPNAIAALIRNTFSAISLPPSAAVLPLLLSHQPLLDR
jgi:hypothetical protein